MAHSSCLEATLAKMLSVSNDDNEKFPVVVRLKEESQSLKLSELCSLETVDETQYELEQLKMMTGKLCRKTIQQLVSHPDVEQVCFDHPVKALLDTATPTIGAIAVKNQFGVTGEGVTIAILDTGIYPHPDLTKPRNRIIAFKDFVNSGTTPYDDHGHGTHVAGDAAGNGYTSGGTYKGPAPEANLVGVKVLDGNGGGSISTVIAGIDWTIENKDLYKIRIMNLSLGAIPYASFINDPMAQAVRRAWRKGIVVFAAAGNTGPTGTINTPGFDPLIITIGAMQNQETIKRGDDFYANYTSRGPTVNGFKKPDLAAPGSNITSLYAPNSTLAHLYPENRVGTRYFVLSGTSMATPICAGACALLLQAYPNLAPDRVKALLMESAQFKAANIPGYIDISRTFLVIRV
jgi:serine protease AprX